MKKKSTSQPAESAAGSNTIIVGDCVSVMSRMPDGCVDLVFADPPFNIGYEYDRYDDRMDDLEYMDWSSKWMEQVHRLLKPSGSFYLAIGDEYAADLCVLARRKLGFRLRNWIIWHYTFGQQTRKKFSRSHTHILYLTKTNEFTFNADTIRVPSARQTVYRDKRANASGKLPDDVWYLRPQESLDSGHFAPESDTWHIPRVCGTFKEREGWHGCQMPEAVLDRIIKVSSRPGDLVLDPFSGSGTTCAVARKLGRRWIGIELSEKYAERALARVLG
ncbi:MAG: hypothetical protein KatS3mg104_3030 [Phycisphaerae bacterium]|nr:MAG: hypothetical protein KatS3mg104_3030 [Phycisphaerae bacterium]